jgi:hypothetical protein
MWCWLIVRLLSVASLGAIVGEYRLMGAGNCKDRAHQTASGAQPESNR